MFQVLLGINQSYTKRSNTITKIILVVFLYVDGLCGTHCKKSPVILVSKPSWQKKWFTVFSFHFEVDSPSQASGHICKHSQLLENFADMTEEAAEMGEKEIAERLGLRTHFYRQRQLWWSWRGSSDKRGRWRRPWLLTAWRWAEWI